MMQTIAFYSYKGGVGRSLLVANTAKYLSTLGKKVFAIDLDLEAPGLHYKFELGLNVPRSKPSIGVVDILSNFLGKGEIPSDLRPFTTNVRVADDAEIIHLMRAGMAPAGEYWRQLARINWFDLFYSPDASGVPFFLELKQLINHQFEPDFLLIDSRTGLTEMGGVATTLLADQVVGLALASNEHLDGLRAVLNGIKKTTLQEGRTMNIVAAISRLPIRDDEDDGQNELSGFLNFLNDPIDGDKLKLNVEDVMILHSEPLLEELGEHLLVGSKNGPHEIPLLRDYLRLFSKIIPPEDIRPQVGKLIQSATGRLLDDPDAAQGMLEALTTYCADQDAYRALIKLYRLRDAPSSKLMATAEMMWHLRSSTGRAEPLLFEVVSSVFHNPQLSELHRRYATFAEAVWRSAGMKDGPFAVAISRAFLPDHRERAIAVLSEYLKATESPAHEAVVQLIELYKEEQDLEAAIALADRFKSSIQTPAFQIARAEVVLDSGKAALAQSLLQETTYGTDAVRREEPVLSYRLQKLAGHETPRKFLSEALDRAIAREDLRQLKSLAEVFDEMDIFDEFEARVRTRLPVRYIEEIARSRRRSHRRSDYIFRSRSDEG